MVQNLSAAQQNQLLFLNALPPKFERIHRLVEEIASLRADDTRIRSLCRLLDELKAGATALSLNALGETFGMMSMMARRGGGVQLKVRGLREGLASLKINHEGAVRAASRKPDADEAPDR